MTIQLPRGTIVTNERLTWHRRFTFSSSSPWTVMTHSAECDQDSIIITTAEATGIDPARANQIDLVIEVSQRPMHRVPLAAICVFDSVLEARVSAIEKLIGVLVDTNATELAQIAAAFGAKRDHVDHRTLTMPVQIQRAELFMVRLIHTGDAPGPYRENGRDDEIHVDLFGVSSRSL